MQKLVSGFAVIGRAKEPSGGEGGDDLDDPRMEAAMAELEREMAGMDEENPDPRQMGHLMRRMSELTGEKMPGVMEEMVQRLEAGEDPDKLEEEYGDMPELEEFGMGEDSDKDGEGGSVRKSLLRRLRGPVRDPELYEWKDYL
ncbi:MAG: cytochrome C [Oceanipulchritudo sp.]